MDAATPVELGFAPSDPVFIADPDRVHGRLRDDQPILWNRPVDAPLWRSDLLLRGLESLRVRI